MPLCITSKTGGNIPKQALALQQLGAAPVYGEPWSSSEAPTVKASGALGTKPDRTMPFEHATEGMLERARCCKVVDDVERKKSGTGISNPSQAAPNTDSMLLDCRLPLADRRLPKCIFVWMDPLPPGQPGFFNGAEDLRLAPPQATISELGLAKCCIDEDVPGGVKPIVDSMRSGRELYFDDTRAPEHEWSDAGTNAPVQATPDADGGEQTCAQLLNDEKLPQ